MTSFSTSAKKKRTSHVESGGPQLQNLLVGKESPNREGYSLLSVSYGVDEQPRTVFIKQIAPMPGAGLDDLE